MPCPVRTFLISRAEDAFPMRRANRSLAAMQMLGQCLRNQSVLSSMTSLSILCIFLAMVPV